MQGDQKVIDYLNAVLRNELTAINQYFLHARMMGNWGYPALESFERQESIDEMKHADELIERILFLEGLPNLQDLGKLYVGEDVPECLNGDLRLEHEAIPVLREAIGYFEQERDFVSRDLLEKILAEEEDHVDWLETQLQLIEQIGLANYLQDKL